VVKLFPLDISIETAVVFPSDISEDEKKDLKRATNPLLICSILTEIANGAKRESATE
jgi:hypothetical protein